MPYLYISILCGFSTLLHIRVDAVVWYFLRASFYLITGAFRVPVP